MNYLKQTQEELLASLSKVNNEIEILWSINMYCDMEDRVDFIIELDELHSKKKQINELLETSEL